MSMNISSSDMQALQAMFDQANQIPWATLLGSVQSAGTPPLGTPTTDEQKLSGSTLQGGPTVDEQALMGMGEQTFTVPGFGNMTAAQVNALPDEQKNAVLRQWSSVVSPGTPWPFGTLSGQGLNTAVSKMLNEIGSGAYKGYGMTQSPTLANSENFTGQFGRVGNFGGPGGFTEQANSPLTLNAQKQYMDAILNAPKGPADAFSYLAKEQSMANPYNPVAQLLGNNVQAATGQSLANLSNTPTLSNTQLASDLVNSQNGGSISPLTQQFLSRSLQPSAYAPGGASSQAIAGGPTTDQGAPGSAGTTIIGGTHYHSPVGFQATTGVPTGFQTSLQDFNKLEPEAQAAFLDLQQTAGGQTPNDFNAGLKQGAPEFGKVAAGNISPSAL